MSAGRAGWGDCIVLARKLRRSMTRQELDSGCICANDDDSDFTFGASSIEYFTS
jgi:hypothetical protein